MPGKNGDDDAEKGALIDRRSYMKTTAAAAAAATGLATAGGVSAATTIDLGNEGLSEGDRIDGYLDQYFTSGNEVHIPAGRYKWNGNGLGGSLENAALIGDGDVVFESTTDVWNENIFATGGEVLIKNITVRGTLDTGGNKCRLRFDCRSSSATMTLDNFNLPDGDEPGGRSIGIYVGKDHSGTLNVRNCHIEGFPNNGLYAGAYGYSDGGHGQVHVDRCFFKDNNIDAVRLGGTNDSIRNSVIVAHDVPRAWNGASTGRGVRVRYPGDDITVENVHITSSESIPFHIPQRKSSWDGSGTINDLFIDNSTGSTAANIDRGDWTGSNIHVSGSGNTNVSGFGRMSNVVQGSNATSPATSLSELDGSSGDGSTGDGSSGDGSTGDGSSGGGTTYDHTLTIQGQEDQGRNYAFTVDGEVVKSEANGASINPDDHLDGSSVEGIVYWGEDSYQFNGSITAFDIEDGPTVSLDGQQIDPATLGDSPDLGHTLTIEGTNDGEQPYSLAVSGDLEKSDEGGASINPDDSIDGSTADGQVYWGVDRYRFSGELTELSVENGPNVQVDGQQVDPSTIGSPDLTNRVVIDARDFSGANAYSFEVTGDVEPSTDFPPESGDAIDGSTVQGTVGGEVDAYRYSGDLASFSLDGAAKVVIEDNDN